MAESWAPCSGSLTRSSAGARCPDSIQAQNKLVFCAADSQIPKLFSNLRELGIVKNKPNSKLLL